MAVGSGIGSSFGIAPEATYGTYVPPVRFYETKKASVSRDKNTTDWDGLAAGRLGLRADGRVITTTQGKVSVDELAVTSRDMGLLFNMIFGGTVAPAQQGATAAYLQTHALGDTFGKMFTAQSGVPTIGGTVIPQSGIGSKITSAEFECGVDDLLTVKVEADSRDVTEGQALAAPSYTIGRRPFNFRDMNVKLGATAGAAAAVSGIRKVNLKVDRKIKTDMFYANAQGLKDQPVTNDFVEVSGTISADYKTPADLADRFRDDTQFALIWEFIGPVAIASTYYPTVRFTVPAAFLDKGTPEVDGPDIVQTDYDFKAYLNLTDPMVTLEYMSADTTL